MLVKIFEFREHDFTVKGEKEDLIQMAKLLRESECEGTIGDLVYQIEYAFDIDGIRSEDCENEFDLQYEDIYIKEIIAL